MNRRELVAGIGSAGILAGAGGLRRYGLPSFGSDDPGTTDDGDGGTDWPIEVETIDARGSDAGSTAVPGEAVTVVSFFVTACGNCQAQVPRLGDARERLADRDAPVRFLSLTYETPEMISPEDLRDWWTTHDGNWTVGYDSTVSSSYGALGYPTTIVVDPDGEKHWHETDVVGADRMVRAVDSVLEDVAATDDGEPTAEDGEATVEDEDENEETSEGDHEEPAADRSA